MKISSAKFIGSFAHLKQLPKDKLPEIAFAGRSNVGKSSLINCLLNRKKIALTSSTPGKTRLLNYYTINENFYFVDLPGYGFAKVSRSERLSWKKLIESFITTNENLKGIVQIIDSRHGITKLDLEMLSWIHFIKLPLILVATKTDKLPNSKRGHLLKIIKQEAREFQPVDIFGFSTVSKQGKHEIWQSISRLLSSSIG
ncbi:YihA family ribosome biogenesis GTP-binding protein [candidate division KSB1 bacterium]|nr:YihA family ribosome biogenesis GTP-binding protein [candidate division KSB1 bacterium]MBL7094161.1 YihA family ribosome biogenesis GTP-binding protein [candidate division KSB1 bacterium]